MSKVAPFHSKKNSDRKVYHDNNECTEGNNIEKYYLASGTDNRPLCEHCKKINEGGK
jgi:hypothetical protein